MRSAVRNVVLGGGELGAPPEPGASGGFEHADVQLLQRLPQGPGPVRTDDSERLRCSIVTASSRTTSPLATSSGHRPRVWEPPSPPERFCHHQAPGKRRRTGCTTVWCRRVVPAGGHRAVAARRGAAARVNDGSAPRSGDGCAAAAGRGCAGAAPSPRSQSHPWAHSSCSSADARPSGSPVSVAAARSASYSRERESASCSSVISAGTTIRSAATHSGLVVPVTLIGTANTSGADRGTRARGSGGRRCRTGS